MKKRNKFLMILIGFIIIFIVVLFIIISINPKKEEKPNKYLNDENYVCDENNCVSKELELEEISYQYKQTVSLENNEKTIHINSSEENFEYEGVYQKEKNNIKIQFEYEEILFEGNYNIETKYIKIDPICENCSNEKINEIFNNYRDDAYNKCMNLVQATLTIIQKEDDLS